jgi:polysaccharide biosynthesis protein PslH
VKIYLITQEVPYPPINGLRLDTWNRIVALSRLGISIHLVTWFDEPVPSAHLQILRGQVDSVALYPRNRAGYLALHPRYPSQVVSRRLPRATYKAELSRAKAISPDVILLDHLAGAVLGSSLAQDLNVPLVYRSHNVEHQYVKNMALTDHRIVKKMLLMSNVWRTRSIERFVRHYSTLVYDISAMDRAAWKQDVVTDKMRVLNYCLHPDFIPAKNQGPKDFDVLYVGSLHLQNNIVGLKWFARNVAPLLDDLRIVVAGARPSQGIDGILNSAGIDVIANPQDVEALYTRARVLINPIWHGSGVNIKMIELLATGQPVVSTSFGARGLADRVIAHVHIADHPKTFATTVRANVNEPFSAVQQATVIEEYGWENIVELVEALKTIYAGQKQNQQPLDSVD